MCEIFGVCSKNPINITDYLKQFYSHSDFHPHGWGLSVLDNDVNIEKEPIKASKSQYLKERMQSDINSKLTLAHIRYATIGNLKYQNCHPFTLKDQRKQRWVLIHNGTIFEYKPLSQYIKIQKGDTDSERILHYLVNQRNYHGDTSRFKLFNHLISKMAKNNKLNLMFYDGEYFFVHTNYPSSLHYLHVNDGYIFSTKPLSNENWQKVKLNTLLAFKDGELVYTGDTHNNTFIDNHNNQKDLYQIFSEL